MSGDREPRPDHRPADAEAPPAETVRVSPQHAVPRHAVPTVTVDATVLPGSGPAVTPERDVPLDRLVTPECAGRYAYPAADGDAEIGRGGIGRVLGLFDRHVGREVALKELDRKSVV